MNILVLDMPTLPIIHVTGPSEYMSPTHTHIIATFHLSMFQGLLKDSNLDQEEDSVFYQMQTVFGHLMESRLQFYEPERFWRVFKLWGHPVNIREQQDAFEFFTNLTDQLDEFLKVTGHLSPQ